MDITGTFQKILNSGENFYWRIHDILINSHQLKRQDPYERIFLEDLWPLYLEYDEPLINELKLI
jgi:hypothetical protein